MFFLGFVSALTPKTTSKSYVGIFIALVGLSYFFSQLPSSPPTALAELRQLQNSLPKNNRQADDFERVAKILRNPTQVLSVEDVLAIRHICRMASNERSDLVRQLEGLLGKNLNQNSSKELKMVEEGSFYRKYITASFVGRSFVVLLESLDRPLEEMALSEEHIIRIIENFKERETGFFLFRDEEAFWIVYGFKKDGVAQVTRKTRLRRGALDAPFNDSRRSIFIKN